ncbi:hypothetical protein BH11BAC3_BH11BAC3_05220 [soil metagenome]
MNINRHNYETFFLLYIDNELSVADRKAVDVFVQENTDLQEEFLMLTQSILKADDVVFDAKELLFKKESVIEDLQEKLLLLLDQELDKNAGEAIEALIEKDTSVKKEWELLQQTKLNESDKVIFENKEVLYRKEAGRIIPFPWLRIAAAAVFIGFALWGGVTYFNSSNQQTTGNGNTIAVKENKVTPKIATPKNDTVTDPVIVPEVTNDQTAIAQTDVRKNTAAKNQSSTVKKQIIILPKTNVTEQPSFAATNTIKDEPKTNNLPKPHFENINNLTSNKSTAVTVTPEKPNNLIIYPGKNELAKPKQTTENSTNTFATTASIIESSEDRNGDHVLLMDEEKIKKTKLGGFLKKVKRVLDRNANINSGDNNIKIANLEFAIQ